MTVDIVRSQWYTHLRAATRINEDLRNIVIDSVQTIFNAFVVHVFEFVSSVKFLSYVERFSNFFRTFPSRIVKNKN